MPHSAFTDSFIELSPLDQKLLLQIARQSLTAAVSGQKLDSGNIASLPKALQQNAACFVTLTHSGELRGCIGSLEARRPLIHDVIDNARAAALRDPRFPPVTAREVTKIHIEISILSPTEPILFDNEQDLLAQIAPFTDGLVLEEGMHRATFLPLVWEKIPDKHDFLCHLKLKAGLPANYWSPTIRVSRYRTIVFAE